MQALKNYIKQLLISLVVIAAMLGVKFYNKEQSHDHLKSELVETCDRDKACIKVVKKHFDSCFDGAYQIGSKRKTASLNQGFFLNCLNQRAGKAYFSTTNLAH